MDSPRTSDPGHAGYCGRQSLADLDLERKINLDDLISRTYRFDEINEGFALMLAGEVARGVIVFD